MADFLIEFRIGKTDLEGEKVANGLRSSPKFYPIVIILTELKMLRHFGDVRSKAGGTRNASIVEHVGSLSLELTKDERRNEGELRTSSLAREIDPLSCLRNSRNALEKAVKSVASRTFSRLFR